MAEAEAGLDLPIGLTEQKFLQQLARIEAKAIKSAQRSEKAFVQGNQQIGRSFGTMSGQAKAGLQNVSYQLQDIFVQIQGGQGATRALSQQLPQLFSGFGLLGSAIGLVAAAGIPLAASFFSSGEEAKELDDAIKGLNTALTDYYDAAKLANISTDDLVSKYGVAAVAAQSLLNQLAQIAKIEAGSALADQARSLADEFGSLITRVEQFGKVADTDLGALDPALEIATRRLQAVSDQFGLTIPQAQELAGLLKDQAASQSVEDQAAAMQRLAAFLNDAAAAANFANDDLNAMAKAAAEGSLAGLELSNALDAAATAAGGVVATTDQIAGSIDVATASAANLAKALSAAIAVANSQKGSLGAPSLGTFGNGEDITRRAGGLDLQEQQDFRYANLQRIADEAASASRSSRGSRSSGSSGNSSGSATADRPFFGDIEKDLVNLERQISLVGKSNEEVATAKARWELLDEAKKRGIPVNAELSAQIDAQAGQVGRLTAELERAELSQQQFEQAIDGVADAMAGALVAGESLREGLAQVFKQIASDILSSGIRSAISGQFGGGGFNPFALFGGGDKLSGALSGAGLAPSFDGGGYTGTGSRTGGIDGRGGFPAILHPNETVIDHTKGQGVGGQSVVVLELSPDLVASILSQAEGQSVRINQQTASAQAKALPGQVQRIQAQPRRR